MFIFHVRFDGTKIDLKKIRSDKIMIISWSDEKNGAKGSRKNVFFSGPTTKRGEGELRGGKKISFEAIKKNPLRP